ncbi:MAG: hypothetical protein DWQ42_21925 [Planctomycetota bacterium]|nr:MAG: hypothetical protein DWQ42_21925 [Planctomycetota bacterium]REK46759.1 MAG: hypothetical protein DWQ46_06035 [Planctomycetota bacterium]
MMDSLLIFVRWLVHRLAASLPSSIRHRPAATRSQIAARSQTGWRIEGRGFVNALSDWMKVALCWWCGDWRPQTVAVLRRPDVSANACQRMSSTPVDGWSRSTFARLTSRRR